MLYTNSQGDTYHAHPVVPISRVPAKREAIAAFQRLRDLLAGHSAWSQGTQRDLALLHDFIHSR